MPHCLKLPLLVVMLLTGLAMPAQTYLPLTSQLTYGDTLTATITNNGNSPAVFYVEYWRPGLEDIFKSTETYLDYLNNACGPDSCQWPKELANAQALVYKAGNYINRGLLVDKENVPVADQLPVARKLYSTIGIKTGMLSLQCGHKSKSTAIDFLATGKVKLGQVRMVGIDNHMLNDIWYEGKFALMDQDVTAMLFASHYASLYELANTGNSHWISEPHWYYYTDRYGNTVNSAQNEKSQDSESWYQLFLTQTSVTTLTPCPPSQTYNIEGTITLCNGCTLMAEEVVNKYVIDTASILGKKAFNKMLAIHKGLKAAQQTADLAQIKQFSSEMILLLAQYLQIPEAEAGQILINGNLQVVDGRKPWQQLYTRQEVPQVRIHLPKRDKPYVVGTDVKFPGIVTKVDLGSVGDTVLLRDLPGDDTLMVKDFSFNPWGDRSVPKVSNKSFHYLQSGFVDASEGSVDIWCSYNPNIINILGAANIDNMGVPDTLDYYLEYPIEDEDHTTIDNGVSMENEDFKIYSNPSADKVNILSAMGGEVTIFNNAGQLVNKFPILPGRVLTKQLPVKGVYYIQFQNESQRIVKVMARR